MWFLLKISPKTISSQHLHRTEKHKMLKFMKNKSEFLKTGSIIYPQFKNEFVSSGINQTLHRIILEVSTSVSIDMATNNNDELSKPENLTTKKIIRDKKSSYEYLCLGLEEYKLNMMILDANYTFDRNQLLFTFIADNRIDFRKLAKDLKKFSLISNIAYNVIVTIIMGVGLFYLLKLLEVECICG